MTVNDDQIGMRLDKGQEILDRLDEVIKIPGLNNPATADIRSVQFVASELIKALREYHSVLVFLDHEMQQRRVQ